MVVATIILSSFALFVLIVGALATAVALFVEHKGRRHTAYRVLRLVLGAGLGSGGVVALALRVHQAGLIP